MKGLTTAVLERLDTEAPLSTVQGEEGPLWRITTSCISCQETLHLDSEEKPDDIGRALAGGLLRRIMPGVMCDRCCTEAEAEEERRETAERFGERLAASQMPNALRGFEFKQMIADGGRADVIAAARAWASESDPGGLAFFGGVGAGKAQPLDAAVLTPTGWTTMGDIAVGDCVIGVDGQPTEVVGVFPQGVRMIYRVEMSDGAVTECDGDHLWQVRRHDRSEPEVHSADELRSFGLRRENHVHEQWCWEIPTVGYVEFDSTAQLPLKPYALGLLLGDGYLRRTNVCFSTADSQLVQALELGVPEGVSVRHLGGYDYSLTTERGQCNPVLDALRELGLDGTHAGTKFIPREYLFAPAAARADLLRGLLDTEGHVYEGKPTVEYTTVSPWLAEHVQSLVRSLGGRTRIRTKQTSHRLAYRLNISMPCGFAPFALRRKLEAYPARSRSAVAPRFISSIEPVGEREAQCISVAAEDGLYVTDDFIVTHNTRLAATAAFQRLRRHPLTWVSMPILLAQLGAAFSDSARREAISVLTGAGALVLDDLDKVNPSEWARNQVFAAIDKRVQAGTPLLITTNLPPAALGEKFGEPVMSRIVGYCRTLELPGRDQRMRFNVDGTEKKPPNAGEYLADPEEAE